MRVLAVSGSLRRDSHNTQLLRAAVEAAPEGVEVELWEGLGDLPLYDQDLDTIEPVESVRRLREAWGAADAILFSTPEYNGSVPGGLKNAIDWASRPRSRVRPDEPDRVGDRREPGPVRRDVGAAGPAQDPRRRRRTRGRRRASGRPGPRTASTTRAGCSTRSSSSGCGSFSRRSRPKRSCAALVAA